MNLVFWPNSTFSHCSYLTLFTPPKFFDIITVFIVSRVVQSSQEKLNQKKIHMHFSFWGGGGGEVGGEKGALQWWIVEKKSLFAGLKSVS